MNAKERRQFIHGMIKTVEQDLMAKVDVMPDDWEGVELRWLLADRFAMVVMSGQGERGRKRRYNNTLLITRLP